jgi:hypothetical protein
MIGRRGHDERSIFPLFLVFRRITINQGSALKTQYRQHEIASGTPAAFADSRYRPMARTALNRSEKGVRFTEDRFPCLKLLTSGLN